MSSKSSPPDPARDAALRALVAIERGTAAGPALDAGLVGVADPRERALATELTYGVTRWRGALDAELRPLCRQPLSRLTPAVRAAMRLGLYQLRHTDRIPAYAAVAASVDLARRHDRPEAAGLVNAVLRRAAGRGAGASPAQDTVLASATDLAAAYSHPEWLVRRWLARLGPEDTRRLLEADNRPPALSLRANGVRVDGEALRAELAAAGLDCRPGRWVPEAVEVVHGGAPADLPALRAGRCTVQGEASMLVGHVADPQPGEFCLDIAAAPGGKATHLAERMADDGVVVANDLDARRAGLCAQAARRLGLASVRARAGDARALPEEFAGRADVVLADVPCTGLGTLAARPDLRWQKREADIAALAAVQEGLLDAAARCVKPGGRLVYSTCTTEPEENEVVVAEFLASHPEFRPMDLRLRLPKGLREEHGVAAGMLRLWPHVHGTDGFFIAGMVRQGRSGR